ncbi:MAG: response regulator [Anaerolineae bacterium]|jgi:CheY-like chemotaxis protein|nr:response regulator [Anaerolineae bacterium]
MAGILVVEDNNTIRMMYVAALQGLGLTVLEARTVDQAKSLLAAPAAPALVLLDLRLPGEPGQTLIPYIRQELNRPDTVIIVASAAADLEPEVLALGANLFIRKPLDMPALLQHIQRLQA